MTFTIFQANTKAKAAEVNANFDFLSRNRLIALDTSGAAAKSEFDLGDLTVITNGALVGDLLGRSGKSIKVYNASGVLQGSVTYDHLLNLQSATTLTQEGTAFLPKQITFGNGTDADHDIDFTDGNFIFDDGLGQAIATALTKQLDSSWVAGDNQGGLDTGSVANTTIYHCFVIHNPTTVITDFLFSTSASSPTMPSGYTKKTRLGSVLTDGSANIDQRYRNFITGSTQIASFQIGTYVDGGVATFPDDNTIPQISEGFQVMAASITPITANSPLKIEVHTFGAVGNGANLTTALFQDAISNALAAGQGGVGNINRQIPVSFAHTMVSDTISEIDFTVRMGNSAVQGWAMNGNDTQPRMGGVMASTIFITETIG